MLYYVCACMYNQECLYMCMFVCVCGFVLERSYNFILCVCNWWFICVKYNYIGVGGVYIQRHNIQSQPIHVQRSLRYTYECVHHKYVCMCQSGPEIPDPPPPTLSITCWPGHTLSLSDHCFSVQAPTLSCPVLPCPACLSLYFSIWHFFLFPLPVPVPVPAGRVIINISSIFIFLMFAYYFIVWRKKTI